MNLNRNQQDNEVHDQHLRPDVHPNWPKHADPDWEAIAMDLQEEFLSEESRIEARAEARTLEALRGLLTHLISERWSWRRGRGVAIRTIALGWTIAPGFFGNASEGAMALRLGISRTSFSEAVVAAATRFNLRHQGQRYHAPRSKASGSHIGRTA